MLLDMNTTALALDMLAEVDTIVPISNAIVD